MSESGSFFVDTNVLLYRFSATDSEKRLRAGTWFATLWAGGAGRISWQVIFEFYVIAARKMGVSQSVARDAVENLMLWKPEPPTHAAIQRAWHWCDRTHINFWDALIVAAAEQSGCR